MTNTMTRTPTTSLAKLYALRGRERLFRFIWGVSRWLALAITLLAIAMTVDFFVDIKSPTPSWLRITMSLTQVAAFAIAAWVWIVLPTVRSVSLIGLARRVETEIDDYDHRLITAIQLTRSGAQTAGMSKQLIGIVTDEAEDISDKHNLASLADTRRLKWGAGLLLWPIAVLAFLVLFFKADMLTILLKRQMFSDVEIPRDVQLQSVTPRVWPAGDEVIIRYQVESRGPQLADDLKGTVLITFDGQPDVNVDLTLESRTDDTHAIFAARVKSTKNFRYRAWLGDGRTKYSDQVVFVARPQVTIAAAWMLMPGYVPERPDGSKYSLQQRYGDLRLHPPSMIDVPLEPREIFMGTTIRVWDPGSLAHIRAYIQKPAEAAKTNLWETDLLSYLSDHVQKPVEHVKLTLLDRRQDDEGAYPLRSVLMDFTGTEDMPDGSRRFYYDTVIAADFVPLDGQIGANIVANCAGGMVNLKYLQTLQVNRYRLSAVDRFGFESRTDPHRSIDILLPDPPHVELLPERIPDFGKPITEEDIIKDIPVPPGGDVVIMYTCHSPIGFPDPVPGLGKRLNSPARLMLRVNEEPVPRIYLLDEIPQTQESGEYDLNRAEFANPAYMVKLQRQSNGVPFHAKTGDVERGIPRTNAGGVYFFPTRGLKKTAEDGTLKDLEIGDSLEFWIEVTDRAGNQVTEVNSPKRRKEIRSAEEVFRQLQELRDTEAKLRTIERRQVDLFRPSNK